MTTSGCVNRNSVNVETAPVNNAESSTKEHISLYPRSSQTYRYVINAEYVPNVGFIPTPSAALVDYLWLAEAIAFAYKDKEIVATDDFRAIKACKVLDLKFVTAIHCLLSLHKNKVIETSIALEKLKKLEQYGRYNGAIIKDAENRINGETNA